MTGVNEKDRITLKTHTYLYCLTRMGEVQTRE